MAQNGVAWETDRPTTRIFEPATLAAALLLSVAIVLVARRRRLPERLRSPDTRALRVACLLVAGVLTAIWLLMALDFETTIGASPVRHLLPWDMDETFAVLDGRTPLVDFHAQYSQLLPFVAAAALALLGSSVGVWTAVMTAMSGLALLAVYDVFRRVARDALLALVLYVPFLALGLYRSEVDIPGVRYTAAAIFSAWPMRYAGAYLLAWLTARHLDGAAPRRRGVLFCAAALVAINNPEFGIGAFAGTALAVVCREAPFTTAVLRRLVASMGLGLLAAVAAVSAVTLVRAGALPHFEYALEFPHIYGVDGWVLEPMPMLGLHLAIFLTFAAATTLATVRAVRGGEQPVLTGMLMWSGVFGLGAGSYYLGRSDPLNLITLFSAWAFSLMLLTVPVARQLAAARRRLPTPAQLAVAFGFALGVCALARTPAPWEQVARLQRHGEPLYEQRPVVAFVDAVTAPGDAVAIFAPFGHRVAYDLRLRNVSPYSLPDAMPAKSQLRIALEEMRRAHVRTVILSPEGEAMHFLPALERAGFAFQTQSGSVMAMTKRGG